MHPEININFKKKAKELIKKIGKREAAYRCGVEGYTIQRIADGNAKNVYYDCGTLLNWHHEQECAK